MILNPDKTLDDALKHKHELLYSLDDPMLRSPEVTYKSAEIANELPLRHSINEIVRGIAKGGKEDGVIVDGRDIGSFVLPDADLKIFLDADLNVRAQRRWEEINDREAGSAGSEQNLEKVARDLAQRDEQDYSRAIGALAVPEGAWKLDSTNFTQQEIVDMIIKRIKECRKEKGL